MTYHVFPYRPQQTSGDAAPPLLQDAELVERALRGQTDAFAILFDRHAPRVYALAYHLIGDRTEAEDIAQDAFLQALRALPTLREPGSFGAWLTRIATNAAFVVARQRKNLPRAELSDVVADTYPDATRWGSPEAMGLAGEDQRLVRAALDRLAPSHRAALTLREIGGLSYAEIATALGLTRGAVEALLFRARARFRAEYRKVSGAALAPLPQCTQAPRVLAALADNELAGTQRARVIAHANRCAACAATLRSQRDTRARLIALPFAVPAAMKAAVLSKAGLLLASSSAAATGTAAATTSGAVGGASAASAASGAATVGGATGTAATTAGGTAATSVITAGGGAATGTAAASGATGLGAAASGSVTGLAAGATAGATGSGIAAGMGAASAATTAATSTAGPVIVMTGGTAAVAKIAAISVAGAVMVGALVSKPAPSPSIALAVSRPHARSAPVPARRSPPLLPYVSMVEPDVVPRLTIAPHPYAAPPDYATRKIVARPPVSRAPLDQSVSSTPLTLFSVTVKSPATDRRVFVNQPSASVTAATAMASPPWTDTPTKVVVVHDEASPLPALAPPTLPTVAPTASPPLTITPTTTPLPSTLYAAGPDIAPPAAARFNERQTSPTISPAVGVGTGDATPTTPSTVVAQGTPTLVAGSVNAQPALVSGRTNATSTPSPTPTADNSTTSAPLVRATITVQPPVATVTVTYTATPTPSTAPSLNLAATAGPPAQPAKIGGDAASPTPSGTPTALLITDPFSVTGGITGTPVTLTGEANPIAPTAAPAAPLPSMTPTATPSPSATATAMPADTGTPSPTDTTIPTAAPSITASPTAAPSNTDPALSATPTAAVDEPSPTTISSSTPSPSPAPLESPTAVPATEITPTATTTPIPTSTSTLAVAATDTTTTTPISTDSTTPAPTSMGMTASPSTTTPSATAATATSATVEIDSGASATPDASTPG